MTVQDLPPRFPAWTAAALRLMTLASVLGLSTMTNAVAAGDIEAGRDLVTRSCTSCHAANDARTATDAAPSFAFLARHNTQKPGWAKDWLMDPHPPMSGIMLSRQQIDDVTAYLNSLSVQ
jgi:cytochrome c553